MSNLALPVIVGGDEARAPGALVCDAPSLLAGSVDLHRKQEKVIDEN